MTEPTDPATRYRFGDAWFRPSTGEIGTAAGVERLPQKAAHLLEALLERGGGVLTCDEIRELLWPGGKVEFDQGINFLVRTLRKALDESARDPKYIETLPTRGYRLVVPVEREVDSGPHTPGPEAVGPSAPGAVRSGIRAAGAERSATRGFGLVVGIAACAAIVAGVASRPGSVPSAEVPILAIVPLDIDGSTGLPDPVALAESMTVELTGAVRATLRVLGPAATVDSGGRPDGGAARAADSPDALPPAAPLDLTPLTAPEARLRLGACLHLSGTVRSVDTTSASVFLQLIRTSDRAHVWARVDTVPNRVVREAALRLAGEAAESVRRDPRVAQGCPP